MNYSARLRDGIFIVLGIAALAKNMIEPDFPRFLFTAICFLMMWVFLGR